MITRKKNLIIFMFLAIRFFMTVWVLQAHSLFIIYFSNITIFALFAFSHALSKAGVLSCLFGLLLYSLLWIITIFLLIFSFFKKETSRRAKGLFGCITFQCVFDIVCVIISTLPLYGKAISITVVLVLFFGVLYLTYGDKLKPEFPFKKRQQ